MIPISVFFESEKEADHAVSFLVELPALGLWFATQDPQFGIAGWVASDIVVAGDFVICAGALPTWETDRIAMLKNGGIDNITYKLSTDGFARTGNTGVNFLNQDLFNVNTLNAFDLENALVHIRMGFGGGPGDYISVFRGGVDKATATFDHTSFDLADDTVRNITPVPVQIGPDFLPRAFTQQSDAIPIVLGCAEDMPVIQTIGATISTLALSYTTSSTEVFYFETNATYPDSGQIEVVGDAGTETLTYTSVETTVVNGLFLGKFTLSAVPTLNQGNGAIISLKNFTPTYMFGFATHNIRRVRLDTGAPSVAPLVKNQALAPSGADHRKVSIVEFSAEQSGDITATMAGAARGLNLMFNGNFDDNVTGWTIGTGAQTWVLPAGTFDRVLELKTLVSQTLQSDTEQDITVEVGVPHRLTFTFRNVDLGFAVVQIGTTTDPDHYYEFSNLTSTAESLFDLTFVPEEATLRIILLADNTTPGNGSERTGYFDQFDLYDITTENPSVQIEHLINAHMRPLVPDPESFFVSNRVWAVSRDRLAGVLQEAEEPQALLGRIAQQFRAKTFLDESGRQHIVAFDQSAPPRYNFDMGDVLRGSLSVGTTPILEVNTHFNVYWGRAPLVTDAGKLGGRAAFAGLAFANPDESNSASEAAALTLFCNNAKKNFNKTSTLDIFADLIPDVRTAENLLSYICRKGTHTRRVVTFTTFLRASHLEIGDMVTMTHLLTGPRAFYEITGKSLVPNGCQVQLVLEEVKPFAFGSYTERWEPPLVTGRIRRVENWEPPSPPEPLIRDCNPFLETWEPDAQAYPALMSRDIDGRMRWRSEGLTELLMGMSWQGPSNEIAARAETFSPRIDGAAMHPHIDDDTFGRTPAGSSIATSGPSYKFYGFPNGGFETEADPWGLTTDAFRLRPQFQEFIKIHGGVHATHDRSSNRAESIEYTDNANSSISNVGMTHDLSFRILVKLDNKSDDYPIWVGHEEDPLSTQTTKVPFAIWYDKTADRFAFGVSNNVPGSTASSLQVDSLTQRILANTLGSPSTGVFYQLLCTWVDATNTVSIKVDNTAVDSTAITPDYAMDVAHVGLIGAWPWTIDGSDFFSNTANEQAATRYRPTLAGWVGLFGWWARALVSVEGDTLWNGGSPPLHFGPNGTL